MNTLKNAHSPAGMGFSLAGTRLTKLIDCPKCKHGTVDRTEDNTFKCADCGHEYPVVTPPLVQRQVTIGCCTLIHGDCFEIMPGIIKDVNAVICDPPFSERTHAGHDTVQSGAANEGNDFSERRPLGYDAWNNGHVSDFCKAANVNGWLVVLTDHVLAKSFESEQQMLGRYVFAPLPSFTPGRSVRLCGDGPSSWTDWIMVSRTAAQSKWGTLPGGYVNKPINRDGSRDTQMGGKPIGLMCALVRDYSREGQVVCDPCMGSGTTGISCYMTGRKFIGIEKDEGRFNNAVARITRELQQQQMTL